MANAFIDWMQKKVQQDVVNPVERDVIHPAENLGNHLANAFHSDVAQPVERAFAPSAQPSSPPPMAQPSLLNRPPTPFSAASRPSQWGSFSSNLKPAKNPFGPPTSAVGSPLKVNKNSGGEDPNAVMNKLSELTVQPITRGAVEIPASITGHAWKVPGQGNRVGKALFGTAPINPIQQDVRGVYRAHANNKSSLWRKLGAGALATGDLALHVANDIPELGAGVKVLKDVAPALKDAGLVKAAAGLISKFGEPALKGAENASGLSRDRVITDNEANTLKDYADHIGGDLKLKAESANNLHRFARGSAHTAGVDITSGSPADRIDRIYNYLSQRRQFLNAHKSIGEGGYAKVPFLEPGERELSPDAINYGHEMNSKDILNDNINSMYNYDKGVKGGTKQVTQDGFIRSSEHSPFFRAFRDENGKNPTKADYATEVKRQMKLGGGNLVPREEADAYQIALDRESVPTPTEEPVEELLPPELHPKAPVTTPEISHPLDQSLQEEPNLLPDIEQRIASQNPMNPEEPMQSVGDIAQNVHNARMQRRHLTGLALDVPESERGDAPLSKLDKETYGSVFNLPKYQVEKDFNEMRKDQFEKRHMSLKQLQDLGPQHKLSLQRRRELIATDPKQATGHTIELNPLSDDNKSIAIRAKSAIAQANGINEEADSRLRRAVQLGTALSTHDKSLLYEYDDGANLSDLIKKAEHPAQFEKASSAITDALDYDLAARRAGGEATLRQHNYIPHNYAVSEEWLKAHKIPEGSIIKNKHGDPIGFRDESAKYRSYAEAKRRVGINPLYEDPIKDVADYTAKGNISRRNNLLGMALAKAVPKQLAGEGEQMVDSGRMRQAANDLPFYATEELQKALRGYTRRYQPITKVGQVTQKVGSGANTLSKRVLFAGSPFHLSNLSGSYIGKNLLDAHDLFGMEDIPKGEQRFLRAAATKGGYQRILDSARADGSLEAARKMGVVVAEPTEGYIPRSASAFALTEVQTLLKRGLNPDSEKALQLGEQINHLVGHRNIFTEHMGRIQRGALHVGALAPNWTTTQLQLVKDALTKWRGESRAAGTFARKAVVGKQLALGGAAIGAQTAYNSLHNRKLTLPTSTQLKHNLGLDPGDIFLPNVMINQKTKSGEGREMAMPTTPLGLASGFIQDPSHFSQSRLSPIGSFAEKVLTDKNWNGNQLASGPHNLDYYLNLVKNAGINSVEPIGLQNFTNFTNSPNNPDILQGLGEEFGGRLKTNPNDPKYKSAVAYYHMQDNLLRNANQFDAPTLQSYFARNTNANGQKISSGTAGGYYNAKDLLGNYAKGGHALQSLYLAEHKLKGSDPMWSLPFRAAPGKPSILNYLAVESQLEGNEKDGYKIREQGSLNKGWITDLSNARNAYYNKLGPSSDAPANEPAYPSFDTQTAADMKAADSIANSTQYSQFLDSHPDVIDAFARIEQWTNGIRKLEGGPPLPQTQQASPELQNIINTYNSLPPSKTAGNTNPATQHMRSNWIKANQGAYDQMIQYYAQSSMNSLLKNAITAVYSGKDSSYQPLLKNAKNAGAGIVQTPNGYTLNAALADALGFGAGNSSWVPDASYDQLHFMSHRAKPRVANLKKSKTLAHPIKASYHTPKSRAISVRHSTISHSKRPTFVRRKVTA